MLTPTILNMTRYGILCDAWPLCTHTNHTVHTCTTRCDRINVTHVCAFTVTNWTLKHHIRAVRGSVSTNGDQSLNGRYGRDRYTIHSV